MRYQRPARHAGLRVVGSIGTSENSEPGAVFDDVTSEPLEAALLLYIYRFLMRRRGEYGRRLDAIVHPYAMIVSFLILDFVFFSQRQSIPHPRLAVQSFSGSMILFIL